MNADLASFVNEVFSGIMSRTANVGSVSSLSTSRVIDQSLDESIYDPVGSHRPFSEYNALVPRRPKGNGDAIEIFLAQKRSHDDGSEDPGDDETTATEQQAIFVASRIQKMISDGEFIRDVKASEQPRKINYGDIAILLRSRSKLAILEEALSDLGVPYVVTSGIGFYSAQEIFDLTNYLSFLIDNNSDIALADVLRSPFFGISENELYQASMCHGTSLFEKFKNLAQMESASDEVKYAASVIDDEIQLAHRVAIPQLVNRILDRTGWLGAYRLIR